jgi:aspartate/methionine/tyrosine aminotransferase
MEAYRPGTTNHAGILELREAIASHLGEPYDVVYDADRGFSSLRECSRGCIGL